MKNFPSAKFTRLDAGRSLVEVMIALSLGLLVLLAISALFVMNRQTYRLTDEKARMEQEGRLALNLMAFHMRMAGSGALRNTKPYKPDPADGKTPISAVFTNLNGGFQNGAGGVGLPSLQGCPNGFANPATATTAIPLPCVAGTGNDAISVRYVGDVHNANQSAGNLPVDCLGAAVMPSPDQDAAGGVFYIVENRFYVAINAASGSPELYCRGNGSTPPGADFINPQQPIAENVEQLRITYGVSSPLNPLRNEQVVDSQVSAAQALALGWDNVISARICLLMRSANNGVVSTRQQYRDCDDNLVLAPDLRMRSVYSSVVAIRAKSAGNL